MNPQAQCCHNVGCRACERPRLYEHIMAYPNQSEQGWLDPSAADMRKSA